MTSKRTYGNPSPEQLEYEIAVEAERKRRANAWLELDELRAENERLTAQLEITQEYGRTIYASAEKYQGQRDELRAENERLRTALTEITELDLEGDASLGDALAIADEAINPSPAC